jgi:hypothetical protein
MTYERLKDSDIEEHVAAAKAAGFTTISLKDVYNTKAPDELAIAPWDGHPNVIGHQLVADDLYRAILDKGIVTTPHLAADKTGIGKR